MGMPAAAAIATTLKRHWGFDTLRPLQAAAVEAALAGKDALVVLPTGGGKSLCYQLPPLLRSGGLTLVVSPLIALMKDQVDGLVLEGYPAAALHSNVSSSDAAKAKQGVESGRVRLLYVSPERLLMDGFLGWMDRVGGIAAIAIDEAHCISQWGHDFRPEYRRLAELRERLPGVPMHAYTATATPQVRDDIVRQLKMRDPAVIVGTFDRPNLTYRVLPRVGDGEKQIAEVLHEQNGEAAIVYCITRKQTESLAAAMTKAGIPARAYHAGLPQAERAKVQEDFVAERLNVVVATVAFGMGIDRGDVRLVVHASMPKSIEAYQQETGRAGRDGLPAACTMFYASSDVARWLQLGERSIAESEVDVPLAVQQAQRDLLFKMQRFSAAARCRHRALSEYFGQDYVAPDEAGCGACDVCNAELEEVPDGTTVARKLLSGVARLRGDRDAAFGAAYIADVVRGANVAKIRERGHEKLSTFGIVPELDKDTIVSLLDQLVDQGALTREGTEYPVLRLTAAAGPILKGGVAVRLMRVKPPDVRVAAKKRRRQDGSAATVLSGDERALFEALRKVRREIATERGVPPFVVFGDAVLEEMSRRRPDSPEAFLVLKGVGESKREQFGARFLDAIRDASAALGLAKPARAAPPRLVVRESKPAEPAFGGTDPWGGDPSPWGPDTSPWAPEPEAPRAEPEAPAPRAEPTAARKAAFDAFRRGESLDRVAEAIGRARATVVGVMVEWIAAERPESLADWVDDGTWAEVAHAIDVCGDDRLKPIFDHLGGRVDYDTVRIVVAHVRALRL